MKPHRAVSVLAALSCLGLAAGLTGCADDNLRPGFGSVRVVMTDAPAAYDQVNIVIREVRIHSADAADEDGWFTVRPDSATTYDLLDLRNGVFVTLGFARSVPAGAYDQVRLVLGDGSTVVVDGVTHPLVTPSGQSSGIKVIGRFDVVANGTTEVMLDFDAERSIRVTGNDTYMLHPVIRLVAETRAGAIHGDLEPATDATIEVLVADTTFASTTAAGDGQFTVAALPPGTYDVRIDVVSGFRDTTIADVPVTAGTTTELGTIALTPQ